MVGGEPERDADRTAVKRIIVADAIFDRFPEFVRGVVVVNDVTIRASYKPVRRLLRAQVADAVGPGDPRIATWEAAHRAFGSDPDRFPPSIASLVRRVSSEPNLPFVNSVVALFNTISLKYVLPCGGDDLDEVEGDLVLGPSDGTETFRGLGSDVVESPEPGEVIYADEGSKSVLCRRWNWRNGDRTKITEATKRLVINVDGLPPTSADDVRRARDELAALLTQHAGASVATSELSSEKRFLALS